LEEEEERGTKRSHKSKRWRGAGGDFPIRKKKKKRGFTGVKNQKKKSWQGKDRPEKIQRPAKSETPETKEGKGGKRPSAPLGPGGGSYNEIENISDLGTRGSLTYGVKYQHDE